MLLTTHILSCRSTRHKKKVVSPIPGQGVYNDCKNFYGFQNLVTYVKFFRAFVNLSSAFSFLNKKNLRSQWYSLLCYSFCQNVLFKGIFEYLLKNLKEISRFLAKYWKFGILPKMYQISWSKYLITNKISHILMSHFSHKKNVLGKIRKDGNNKKLRFVQWEDSSKINRLINTRELLYII